ncbi:MAG TPA: redoxin family protein [Mycobacteriales bacterium]|nr:redoxin family protein [Mycobacteriales bacterium]
MGRSKTAGVAAVVLAAISVLAVVVSLRAPSAGVLRSIGARGGAPLLKPAGDSPPAPELTGISGWLNSDPLTMAGLQRQRQVVLVDFWTYSCINCRRTFPFLRRLQEAYGDSGLTIVGVHTPEFDFEKIPENVADAVEELDVTWPVAQDPAMSTWNAFGNQYWPAKYLIDSAGRIRGFHIGEGDEAAVEMGVRTLLREAGATLPPTALGGVTAAPRAAGLGEDITRELYLGAQRGADFYDAAGPVPAGSTETRDDGATQNDPPPRDRVRLTGEWSGAAEYTLASRRGSRLAVDVRARDVYLLVAPERGFGPVELEVQLRGQPVPPSLRGRDITTTRDGRTVLVVGDDDLRHVITGASVAEHALTFTARRAGVRFYAFTFGG